MAKGGVLGNGFKVAYSLTSPVSWVEMDDVLDMTFPTWQAAKVEITTSSVTNKLRRYMAGLIEVGDPGFTVLADFNPVTSPNQSALRAANKTGASLWWRFEVPTNRERTEFWGITFQAGVLNYNPDTPIDGRQTVHFDLSFDGEDIIEDPTAGASQI
jgi:hypothetical protein